MLYVNGTIHDDSLVGGVSLAICRTPWVSHILGPKTLVKQGVGDADESRSKPDPYGASLINSNMETNASKIERLA